MGTYAAEAIVFLVVPRFLDRVSPDDGRVAVVVVRGIGGEIDLAEELLLVMFEFADHLDYVLLASKSWLFELFRRRGSGRPKAETFLEPRNNFTNFMDNRNKDVPHL